MAFCFVLFSLIRTFAPIMDETMNIAEQEVPVAQEPERLVLRTEGLVKIYGMSGSSTMPLRISPSMLV